MNLHYCFYIKLILTVYVLHRILAFHPWLLINELRTLLLNIIKKCCIPILHTNNIYRIYSSYTVRKGYRFSLPQPGCHRPNSPWPGTFELFPARESLVSEIPAWDWKIYKLFFSVYLQMAEECKNMIGFKPSSTPITKLVIIYNYRTQVCTHVRVYMYIPSSKIFSYF